jgi:hypothetical protein
MDSTLRRTIKHLATLHAAGTKHTDGAGGKSAEGNTQT